MSFPLDVTDSAISRLGNVDAEVEAGVAGAQGEAAQIAATGGTKSHNVILRRRLDGRSEEGSLA